MHTPQSQKTSGNTSPVSNQEERKGRTLPAVPAFQNNPVQKKELEEEEPLQGKFPAQLQGSETATDLLEEEEPVVQKKENHTGLPDSLKEGVENLSGIAMDDVRVHYNSDKPAQLQALAYAQGTDIHVGPGQEKHLPHEAWHVVQQKQGRVQATRQMKEGVAVNDDKGLENEADVMGEKSLNPALNYNTQASIQKTPNTVKQFVVYPNEAALWQAVAPDTSFQKIRETINANNELKKAFEDSLLNLNRMNFVNQPGTQPVASYAMNVNLTYDILYGLRSTQKEKFKDEEKYIGAIIHEMGHVNSGLQYNTNVPHSEIYHVANMHLPGAVAPFFNGTPVGENQRNDPATGWEVQKVNMETNWDQLKNLRTNDHGFTTEESDYLKERETYAKGIAPETHYDTVLVDILYYLQHHGLTETHYYLQATAMLQEANARRRAGNGTVPLVPLLPQPANKFLELYNQVSILLNDQRWANEGEAFVGKKTPSGVTEMRKELNDDKKRISLNQIQKVAIYKTGKKDKGRSESTTELYVILSKVNQRSNFEELIADIKKCSLWLGRNKNEPVEIV